jgi:hypothetical protein
VLCLFRGDARLVGETGSLGPIVSSGSKISDGSIASPVLTLRVLADFFGESLMLAVVWRRVDLRGLLLFAGAGVNSSSLSSWMRLNSSSDSSTTTGRRVARRDGRTGDSADILYAVLELGCVTM